MRLWLRDELRKVESYLVDFLKVMAARAEQEISWSCQDTNIFSEPNLSSGVIGQGLENLPEVIVRVNQNKSSKEGGYFSFPSHTNAFTIHLVQVPNWQLLWCGSRSYDERAWL
jgi:hypothetical protein